MRRDERRQLWRMGIGAMTAICAAAGAGLMLAALTMQAPRPPQPSSNAEPVPLAPEVAPMARAEPTRIFIPVIEITANLLSLGVDQRNELAVPPLEKANDASWYNLGPSPGERGSAIIVGHVDSEHVGGPAVFFNLGKLEPGDEITISRKDGSFPKFKVDSVKTFPKTDFPAQLVYTSDQPTLKVITCGGDYDKKTRNYLSNVVVFATLSST